MAATYTVLSTSGDEPLDLEEDVKPWLHIDGNTDDAVLSSLITRVRAYAERVTRRALILQTIEANIPLKQAPVGILSGPVDYPAEPFPISERAGSLGGMTQFYLKMPMSPLQTLVTVAYQLTPFDVPEWNVIDAVDPNGNDNYRIDNVIAPSRVYFAGLLAANRFQITYTAGYTAAMPLPPDLAAVLLEMITYRYYNREVSTLPTVLTEELMLFRIPLLG